MAIASPPKSAATVSWFVPLLVLIAGSFLPPMDSAIVSVPIPHIQKDLGGGVDDVAWVSTAFSLGLAVFVPLSNWLTDKFGLTMVHRVSLIGFLVGSGLCGVAWDLPSLIAFRVLTAIPGSIVPVVTIAMIYRIVPTKNIGAAMGLYGLGVIVAPSMGPTIGGLLVQDLSWRWIFFFKEPIGIAAVIAGLFLIPKMTGAEKPGRFDKWGYLTFAYGLSAIIVVSAKGQKWHWDSYLVMILATSGVLSLALFAVIENEVTNPLIDLRIFRCWPFVNSLLLIGVMMIILFGVSYYIPQFVQNVQGKDAHYAGMALLPMGLMMVIAVPLAGRLYDLVGARWVALAGMVGSIVGLIFLSGGIGVDMSRMQVSVWVMGAMLGGAFGLMPIMTNGLSWLPPNLVGYGGAMNNVMQRTASALGVAIVGVIVSRTGAQAAADMGGMQTAPSMKTALALQPPVVPPVPRYANVDQWNLLGNYTRSMYRVQAAADGNAFVITTWLAVVAALLILTLKKPPAKGFAPAETEIAPRESAAERPVPAVRRTPATAIR